MRGLKAPGVDLLRSEGRVQKELPDLLGLLECRVPL